MDTRKQRSRQKIVDAFMEMRKGKPLERLTVTELCKRAGINKSTFYVHFRDVYDLSEQLEKELTVSIINAMSNPEAVFDDPAAFTKELFIAYAAKREIIYTLFTDSRSSSFPRLIEQSIKELVYKLRPEYRKDERRNIALSFLIYGGYYAYMNNADYSEKTVLDVISQITSIASPI